MSIVFETVFETPIRACAIHFRDDEDLDKTMEDLLRGIDDEADLRHCFTEANARLEGNDERYW